MKHPLTKSAMLLALAGGLITSSCGSGSSDSIDFLPAKSEKNSNWGMVSPDGKMLFEDEFKDTPSAVINGCFYVKNDNGYTIYTLDGNKPKAIDGLEDLVSAGIMSQSVIPVAKKGGRIEYYNSNGKLKFTLEPYKNNEITKVSSRFIDGLAIVELENNRSGAINSSGKMVVEPIFEGISEFSDGLALAKMPKEPTDSTDDEKWVVIDSKGKEKFKLKDMTPVSNRYLNGRLSVKKGDRLGFVDKKGEFLKMPEKVQSIVDYNAKYVIYKGEDGVGVLDMEGQVVVRAKYSGLIFISEDKFLAESDSHKYYIVNNKDERETELQDIKGALPLKYNLARNGIDTDFEMLVVEGEHEYKIYNSKGEPSSKTDFYEIDLRFNDYVVSDYFNAEALATKIANYFTPDGFNGVKIGSPLYNYFKDKQPKDVTYGSYYTFDDIEGGYKYTLRAHAEGNTSAVKSTPVYVTKNYGYYTYQSFDHYDYSWNKEAIVNNIFISSDVSASDQFPAIKDTFVKAMTAKGFKKTADEKAYAVLTSDKAVVFIRPDSSNGSDFSIIMVSKSEWNRLSDSWIYDAVEKYNSSALGKDNQATVKSVMVDAPADTTEVEELVDPLGESYEVPVDSVA